MDSTLEKRILIFVFLILTVTITANTAFNIESFRRSYRDGIVLRCQNLIAELKSSIEGSLAQGQSLPELQDLNARCQKIVGGDPEIAYCLVEDSRGTPLFSSDPSLKTAVGGELVSSLSKTTTQLNLPTLGRVFDVSQPVYAAGDRLAGRVRVGFPVSVLKDRAMRMLNQSLVVLGAAFLTVFTLVFLFTRRHLIGPIQRLCVVAKEIANGNFRVGIPKMPTRDFAELADALQEMARSLQTHDDAVLQGYQELEQTNLLLQKSYEQQEKTSSELSRSQKMQRALFENASDAIVISDHNDRILLFNKRAEEFFGISRDQVIGSNLFQTIEKMRGDAQAQYRLYRRLLEKERGESELKYVRVSDGEPVVGWVSASLVRERKGKFWIQAIIRDVTRERMVKGNLEKSTRELQRLNQMKDSFLGLASHELKTPLTVIVGYADLILSEMTLPVDDPVRGMVRNIAEAAERLTGIVHDMVDVSMLDSRRLPVEVRPIDVNSLIRQLVAESGDFLTQRQQQIILKLREDLPPIQCDPERLRQAFGNLLGNAIKFTPDGGSITFESRMPERSSGDTLNGGVDMVEILIGDTGIGIAESDLEHIFDKFYEAGQIEEHFTAKVAFKGKGTGLGLTIAKGISRPAWRSHLGGEPGL